MGVIRKWQQELVAIAWINIGLIVISLPLFSIYIVESLQAENTSGFVLRTQRGQQFVEVISKYFATVVFWIPMSILLKIGATKPSYTLVKTCNIANLIFMFMLAIQLILESPDSLLVVCAYGVCFAYLLAGSWLMKNFMAELHASKGDSAPVISNLNTNSDTEADPTDNFDEINDVADQRSVFRLQPLPKGSTAAWSKL